MQRQEPRPQPPPPPRPRPQYQQQQQQYERKQERLQLQRAQPRQVYQQYQQHLQQHQPPAQQAQYQSRFPPAEQPQRQEQPTVSPSCSPQTFTASMSPPDNTVSLSYSSLMRDQMASEPEAGMENIQIDEEWIERNGAFACIWALTYKLPTKEAEEMAQAMMSPHTYTKRG